MERVAVGIGVVDAHGRADETGKAAKYKYKAANKQYRAAIEAAGGSVLAGVLKVDDGRRGEMQVDVQCVIASAREAARIRAGTSSDLQPLPLDEPHAPYLTDSSHGPRYAARGGSPHSSIMACTRATTARHRPLSARTRPATASP